MNSSSRSLTLALAICCGLLAIVAGTRIRDQHDLPSSSGKGMIGDLLASRADDFEIGEADYYREISQLLKDNYVETLTDDNKLLSGSVRGMITSLKDLKSQFFNPKEFSTFKKMRQGIYEGIGVYVAFEGKKVSVVAGEDSPEDSSDDDLSVPRLTVVAVTPNGPAAKAGVLPGDVVNSIDDHWVVNGEEILKFRKAQADFQQKKIDFKAINMMRIDLRKKMDKSIMPVRVREKLITGTTGDLAVVWERDGKQIPTKLTKAVSEMPGGMVKGTTLTLPFIRGSAEKLAGEISGKPSITIDLRNNVLGDFDTMRKCLEVLVPAGQYGVVNTQRPASAKAPPARVVVAKGNSKPPKIALIVDRTTRDAAEMFMTTLVSKGLATVSGKSTGNDRTVTEIVELPDGSGYTLATGEFSVSNQPATVKKGPIKKVPAKKGPSGKAPLKKAGGN